MELSVLQQISVVSEAELDQLNLIGTHMKLEEDPCSSVSLKSRSWKVTRYFTRAAGRI